MYLVLHKCHQRDTYTGLVDMQDLIDAIAPGKRKASALYCHELTLQLETLEEGKEKPGVATSEDGQQSNLAHLSRVRAYIP
jgi:hypothetical protein